MPKVYNVKDYNLPDSAVYYGRGSPYGNPFKIGKGGDRDEVIEKFKKYLQGNAKLLAKVRQELRGKDLLCHCKPAKCHADIILIEANKNNLFDK